MKKISLFCFITFFLTFGVIAQNASDNYFFYKEKKVELRINKSLLLVYFNKEDVSYEELRNAFIIENEVVLNERKADSLYAFTINIGNENYEASVASLKNRPYVFDVEPVIEEKGNILVSNKLYVQLKNWSDTNVLKTMAAQTLSTYDGAVILDEEHGVFWYGISTSKESYDALEMSVIYAESGLFEAVDPGFIYPIQYRNHGRGKSTGPSDWELLDQWAVTDLYDIWDEGILGGGVKIALIDDGVDTLHQEFGSLTHVSADLSNGVLLTPGIIYGDHGTNMAGVIFADHDNYDIAGIAPEASLIDISLFNHNNSWSDLYEEDIVIYFAMSLFYAASNNADIILCPWDYIYSGSSAIYSYMVDYQMEQLCLNGRNGKGAVIIFASGDKDNENYDIRCPANSNDSIIVVGGADIYHEREYYSCYGSTLDIVAPGVGVLTTDGHNYTLPIDGSGIASAHVAGVVALMLSANPNLTRSQIDWILKHSTFKSPNYTFGTYSNHPDGTWNDEMGYGEIISAHAIEMAKYFSAIPSLVIKDTINDNGIEPSPYLPAYNSPSIVAKDASNTNIVTTLEPGNSYKINVTVHNYSQTDIAVAPADVKLYYHTYMESFTGTDNLLWKSSFMYGSPLTPSGSTPVTIAGNGGSYTFVIPLTLPEIYPVGAPGTKFYMGLAAIIDSDTSFIHNYSDSNIPFDLFVRENRLVAGKRYLHYQEPIGGIIGPIGPKSTISPNPTGGRAMIDVDIDEMPSDAMIVVSDMYGNIVMYDRMSSTSYRLNLEGKPSGSYYVCIVSSGGIMCMDKVIIY